MQQFTDLKSFG